MSKETIIATTAALKEWAITIEALGSGKQIFVLRKGGIHEETRHFQVQSDQFCLFPAYEHQKKELLKPEYHQDLDEICQRYSAKDTEITISYFARLHEDIELRSEEKLFALEDEHICTNQFAFERFKWKVKQPLHLLIFRVYALKQPLTIPMKEEYIGCKSWLQIPCKIDGSLLSPVLDDAQFSQKVAQIKEKLNDKT